jgi:hypothetical protein
VGEHIAQFIVRGREFGNEFLADQQFPARHGRGILATAPASVDLPFDLCTFWALESRGFSYPYDESVQVVS